MLGSEASLDGGGSMQENLSFLQCYICLQSVKKPRMCPSCSKLACQSCLRTWIQQSKTECPHCRKPLLLGNFADCQRFVNDIKYLLSSMDNNDKSKQKCSEHRVDMLYFCESCEEPICSDCGMFGRHKGHAIIHLSKVYQENKNKILNELAKFDNKIQIFRKNGLSIKMSLQKLILQIGQKKNFIEEYFVGLIERLDDEFKQKKEKIQAKYDENNQQIEFLQTFRENICQQLECKSEKELITKSEQYITCLKSLCERESMIENDDFSFQTIHELVPKYQRFSYIMRNYPQQTESIIYSQPYPINGIEWRLKIYPKGNGVAKNTHLSVFLQLSKGYENDNKYEYRIELINQINQRQCIAREYSSKFDIGECWGYNQFIPIADLSNGFLDQNSSLHFFISVRNPSYRSLVRDQEKFILELQRKLHSEGPPVPQIGLRNEKMNQLTLKAKGRKLQLRKFLQVQKKFDIGEEEIEEVKVDQNIQSEHEQWALEDNIEQIQKLRLQ